MDRKRKKTGPKRLSVYSVEVEQHMINTYNHLSEKDRRIYAAVETLKLPHGGKIYISTLFKCSKNTIDHGIKNLANLKEIEPERVRKNGAGRKSSLDTIDDIDEIFLAVIDNHIAGDPMDEKIRWTNLSHEKISLKMEEKGIKVSKTVVAKLLKKHNFVKRKPLKKKAIGTCANRNEQFENIINLKEKYLNSNDPVISMDTKKKELIGNLQRDGQVYTTGKIEVYDHDFPHLADGTVIPHALYDLKHNFAYVNIGTTKDTSEFACYSIKLWWENYGKLKYPNSASILILADGGGSNSSRHYIFKEDLQKLVNEIGIEIRMAHYPPYTSKWNPVEHRVFPHITKSLKGAILRNHEFVKELISGTTTKTGLKVTAQIINGVFKTGRKYADNFKETMKIKFDKYLPLWNYTAVPQTT